MMESRVDTQARRPSLASVVGTRERERREIPHDVSSDPARQRLHFEALLRKSKLAPNTPTA